MSSALTSIPIKTPVRQAPALRLVKTNDLSREDWLTVRKQGIGSSDAAAAVGLNPYQSQLELWMIKTGRDTNLPQVDPKDQSSPMYWGTLLESIVAAHYTMRSGNKVRRINAVLQHPTEPWMLANIDREVIGAADVQILECKTAGINGARLWRDGVPEYIQLQVQHQLAVTGKPAADVAVLIGGQDLQIHRIERDSAGALHRLNNALSDLNKSTTAPLVRASVLHNLGTTELETGAFAIAHEHLREAEAIRRARLGDQHPDTARTLASLALLMERTRMYPAGLALAREASASIMTMLAGNAGTRAAAASSQERKEWRAIFSTHLRLLARAEPDSARQAGEALTLIQSLKHGELARVFASASIGSDGAIAQRTRQIRQQMGRFQSKDRELTTITRKHLGCFGVTRWSLSHHLVR